MLLSAHFATSSGGRSFVAAFCNYIDDRIRDIVIVGSSNVYPADLERILDECEAVAEAVVVGRPDAAIGVALVACVVVKAGRSLTAEQVKGLLEGRLASYKHLQDVVFMDSFPHTAAGKVRKPALRQMVMKLNTSP